MNRCLVITSSYPFGPGESFFSPELKEISNVFDYVDLLPIRAKGELQRVLPVNVKCLKPLLSSKATDVLNISTSMRSTFRHLIKIRKTDASISDKLNCLRLGAAATKLKPILQNNKYDLIYLYWGYPFSSVLLPINSLAPCVQLFHGSDLWGGTGGAELRKGIEAYAKQPNFIYASSQMGRDLLAASGSFPVEQLFVRYLGSEDLAVCEKTPFSEGLSITSNAFLSKGKRIELIARTVNALSRHVPVKWTHVGGGTSDQMQHLRQIAGPRANVVLEGTIHHSQLGNVFKRARPNLHLSLSASEGLAINVLEAMSADIPIVSSDVGAMREAVTPQAGLLVNETLCNAPEALANTILTETQTDGLLRNATPRSVWINQFDAKKNAIRFANELKVIAHGNF